MNRLVGIIAIVCLCLNVKAQKPYWQQRVNTTIAVTLDDRKHQLLGEETINYTNNSPDTLFYIYLHLYPNAYSTDRSAYTAQAVQQGNTKFYYSKEEDRGFIDSLRFTIDGNNVYYSTTEASPDIARIDLIDPLPPGQLMEIKTPFRVKIPKVFSRLGHSKQAYYISQWFPKPAVYDAKGWHAMPYLDQGEFFSEIGDYDVSITLPTNYVVLATGNLQNEEEIRWMDSLSTAPPSSELQAFLKTNTKYRAIDSIPPSDFSTKTLRFTESNIHDFAFFADKRFLLSKETFTINNFEVTAWAAYLPRSIALWKDGANKWQRKTVEYLSEHVGAYPYKTIKMVEGDMSAGGGMEYPTIAIIDASASSSRSSLRTTIIHEAGHNWFQGILASNERDHPWMDEGINSFYERKIIAELDSISFELHPDYTLLDNLYIQLAKTGRDMPIASPSTLFPKLNYPVDAYIKPSLMMRWLEVAVGEERFEKAMKAYFEKWAHKHPYPADLQAIYQESNLSADWFFNEALVNTAPVDFTIRKGQPRKNKNTTWQWAPLLVDSASKYQDALEGRTGQLIMPAIPDGNLTNNYWKKGKLGHGRGLKFGIGLGTFRKYNPYLYALPLVGINAYDGFMAGAALHNLTFPSTKFRFVLAPMYGFKSKDIAGGGSIGLFLHPKGKFQEVALQLDGKTFHYDEVTNNTPSALYPRYIKIAPSLKLTLRKTLPNSAVERSVLVKGFYIKEQFYDYKKIAPDTLFRPFSATANNFYGLLRYKHQNNRTLNPYSYVAEAQFGEVFTKISLEGKLRIDYHSKNKGLHIRAYAGKFFSYKNEANSRYLINTTSTGQYDYLYEDTYVGRTETNGIGSQQVSIKEGGFKLATPLYANPIGRSDNWLAALNLKTDLPIINFPLRAFLDIATFADAKKLNPSGNRILVQAGVEVEILKMLTIHLPLAISSEYSDYLSSIYGDKGFEKRITFSLDLSKLNLLKLVDNGVDLLNRLQ